VGGRCEVDRRHTRCCLELAVNDLAPQAALHRHHLKTHKHTTSSDRNKHRSNSTKDGIACLYLPGGSIELTV